jgi:hypothetical protein
LTLPHQYFELIAPPAPLIGRPSAERRTPAHPTQLDGSRMSRNSAPLNGIYKIGQSGTPQTV